MIYMVTNINIESYWNPNAWGCLVSQECFSRVPHVNTILKLEKRVLNLYNVDFYFPNLFLKKNCASLTKMFKATDIIVVSLSTYTLLLFIIELNI